MAPAPALAASAYCVPCQRRIRLDGLWREPGGGFQFELADVAGRRHTVAQPDQARGTLRPPSATLAVRFVDGR